MAKAFWLKKMKLHAPLRVTWYLLLLRGAKSFQSPPTGGRRRIDFKSWFNQEKKDLKDDFFLYPKRKFLFLALGIYSLFFFIFRLWTATSFKRVSYWDNLIVQRMSLLRNSFLDNFFNFSTNFASGYFIIIAFLILAFFLFRKKRKKAVMAVLLTLIGSSLFIYFFKTMFSRERPFGCLTGKDCFSFPSGHATIALYFYGMLFHLINRFVRLKKIVGWLLGLFFAFLILLIAFSRVYLGYHYPTDIVGGFFLGGIFLLVAAILVDFLYQ